MACNPVPVLPGETAPSRGEGSSVQAGQHDEPTQTLADVMRAPSTNRPDVMVLDATPESLAQKEVLNPKEDLWLSTSDGRYSSPVIPLLVGSAPKGVDGEPSETQDASYRETFYVHKNILMKSEYFRKALSGAFKESEYQRVELPEEDPAIFHFLIAYLYEGIYDPIKPVASILEAATEKGKSRETTATGVPGPNEESEDSADSDGSGGSANSQRRRERRRRRREEQRREWQRQKHPGMHRPGCNCPQCSTASGPPCWHCAAPPRASNVLATMAGPHATAILIEPVANPDHGAARPGDRHRRRNTRYRHRVMEPAGANPSSQRGDRSAEEPRIAGEDLRTWLLAYELHLDVYILANKFLLAGFKQEVARAVIDMLETAGTDAAVPQVLALCKKLYEGLSESDPLLKMIFARVGFLQPWRADPEGTNKFLVGNPDIAALLLREMAARREEDFNGRSLPSMEAPLARPSSVAPDHNVLNRFYNPN